MLDGLGAPANAGPGHGNLSVGGALGYGSGGGHGGYGSMANQFQSQITGPGGHSYDSIATPTQAGSGGGCSVSPTAGSTGGGVLQLSVNGYSLRQRNHDRERNRRDYFRRRRRLGRQSGAKRGNLFRLRQNLRRRWQRRNLCRRRRWRGRPHRHHVQHKSFHRHNFCTRRRGPFLLRRRWNNLFENEFIQHRPGLVG